MEHTKPEITIHPHSQKSRTANIGQNGIFWPNLISQQDLEEMCTLATGGAEYTLIWLGEDQRISVGDRKYKYNVGNIATIAYKGKITYITFANPYNDGRNSYFQQVGPAYRRFLEDSSHNKSFMFYALPIKRPEHYGNVFTRYHHFMYSVLHDAGIGGNWQELLGNNTRSFQNIEQLIAARNRLSKKNNNASYVYLDSNEDAFYLFLKTYGANKYESFFLALAAINIEEDKEIRIRELEEGKLIGLPLWAQNHIKQCSLGRVQYYSLERGMDEHRPPDIRFPPSLRTPRYRVNVRKRCGKEICAFCDNDNPRDIQAAHVWDVHKLQQLSIENDDNRGLWGFASDGHNGLWLCKEHHRPFDNNTLLINKNGDIIYNTMISKRIIDDLRATITKRQIDAEILTDQFWFYLQKRYEYLDLTLYKHL